MSAGEAVDELAEEEIQQRVWHGAVPILLELSPDQLSGSAAQPEPLFILAPRMWYLPLLANQICDHFATAIPPDDDTRLWLECNGKPVRWHYPNSGMITHFMQW